MPALNFHSRFAPLVESGQKRQTIRAFRKDGRDPKPGDTLYLFTGMQTKRCRKIGVAVVESVEFVDIDERSLVVGNRDLHATEADELARDDGFQNWTDMEEWVKRTYGLPFEGLLIRWGAK